MKDWNREDLFSFLDSKSTGLVYLYTPLCGTCQVASKMLLVIDQLVNVKMGKMNLNYFPDVAKNMKVESVPCLLFVKDGMITQKMYAFHSVPFLIDNINKIL